jgi:hypothetical protein
MFKISDAKRESVKLMVGLSGPSGAGKSLSALKLAYGITGDWKKIAYADTENKSALYYAGDNNVFPTGDWKHVDFNPRLSTDGYHPNNWIKLIDFIEKQNTFEVLILDSISHEWEGRGGCLELVDKIGKGFSSWKTVTPLHSAFIDKMRTSPLHIIATMRSKQDYVVEQNDKGKAAPKKVGLKSSQREGTDYEFGIIFDIEISHMATASKDRTGLFAERGPFQIEPALGKELLTWSKSGEIATPGAHETTVVNVGDKEIEKGTAVIAAPTPIKKPEPKKPQQQAGGKLYDPENINHKEWLENQLKLVGLLSKAEEIEKQMIGKNALDLQEIIKGYKNAVQKG